MVVKPVNNGIQLAVNLSIAEKQFSPKRFRYWQILRYDFLKMTDNQQIRLFVNGHAQLLIWWKLSFGFQFKIF